MLLFSSALSKHNLSFIKLADCMEFLSMSAKWAEGEWGYIRNKGVEYRKSVFNDLKENIYIGLYANQPVSMFALFPHDHLENTEELMYVYVDKEYRGLGFGHQIIEKAKEIAKSQGNELILFDTLKPQLNRLYEKHGARVLCESRLFSHPTDVLSMSI
ncbi:GNAT family N-acetyltransferase [Legionella sp. CNM-1927-20]|uniref:GNAT family N-acetyltransferase n=1 Tax=Legionella sp. CNM-1927-20 TaxID=3422221 RepID=UPI00403A7F17